MGNPRSAAPHGMVYALVAEFDCHRTHYATFANIAEPGLITRILLLGSQVGSLADEACLCFYSLAVAGFSSSLGYFGVLSEQRNH